MNTIKKNIAFNYFSQFYISVIGILILPLFLKNLTPEGYGLVGFFTLLQSWMRLLDMGISPTLGREVASLKGNQESQERLRKVVRSLEVIFVIIAFIIATFFLLSSDWIVGNWLKITALDLKKVSFFIDVMAITISLRFFTSLARSGINAYEEQVWLSSVEILIATLRFPGSLLIIYATNGNLFWFFWYQLIVALVELLLINFKFYGLLPKRNSKLVWFCKNEMMRIAPFAISIGYTGGVWVVISQLDKLLLSKILPLAEYGYFTLVALLSGGVMFLAAPIGRAALPRMTTLLAQGKEKKMIELYKNSTRFVVCVVSPVTLVMAFYPKEIIYTWAGDGDAARWTESILPLFALGSGLLAVGSYQYYLQYVHGKLRHHVIYNTISALISVPLIFFAAFNYGAIGVGWVWLIFRLISLALWAPFVHHLFAPGIHRRWLLDDVISPFIISLCVIYLIHIIGFSFYVDNRLISAIRLTFLTSSITLIVLLFGFRKDIFNFLNEKF